MRSASKVYLAFFSPQLWLWKLVDLAVLLKPRSEERVQKENQLKPKWSCAWLLEAALLWLCASWLSSNTSAHPPALAPLPNPHQPRHPRRCVGPLEGQ